MTKCLKNKTVIMVHYLDLLDSGLLEAVWLVFCVWVKVKGDTGSAVAFSRAISSFNMRSLNDETTLSTSFLNEFIKISRQNYWQMLKYSRHSINLHFAKLRNVTTFSIFFVLCIGVSIIHFYAISHWNFLQEIQQKSLI